MPLSTHETYMLRCLQLAEKGFSGAAPNPLVGAVLVHENRIIGEGWHAEYGKAHAEVNCLASIQPADRALIPHSTLYVSLEPCAHQGKTPPCTALIIKEGIQQVVVGCTDPFDAVNGKGIAQLRAAGIPVTENILENECRHLNRRFFFAQTNRLPYVALKWAQTANGFMGSGNAERLYITHPLTNRLVHRWRTEEMAILVGFNTAKLDNPQLTSRHWPGRQPLRVVVDEHLQLPPHLHLFADGWPTLVLNSIRTGKEKNIEYLPFVAGNWRATLQPLLQKGIQSILVEGGRRTLESFITQGVWNEARVITATALSVQNGMVAPVLKNGKLCREEWVEKDRIHYFTNVN
jgi:diaminohydroxyphosphoribosylaminopyrimidine deaminase / 5-amino-6-(5-phosphoribosylamino)uracil reductase